MPSGGEAIRLAVGSYAPRKAGKRLASSRRSDTRSLEATRGMVIGIKNNPRLSPFFPLTHAFFADPQPTERMKKALSFPSQRVKLTSFSFLVNIA